VYIRDRVFLYYIKTLEGWMFIGGESIFGMKVKKSIWSGVRWSASRIYRKEIGAYSILFRASKPGI
jgi:hypothetical protein